MEMERNTLVGSPLVSECVVLVTVWTAFLVEGRSIAVV